MSISTTKSLVLATVAAAGIFSGSAFGTVIPTGLESGVTTTVDVIEDNSNSMNAHAWLSFTAVAGTQITINVDGSLDSCIELYSGDVTGLDFGVRTGTCSRLQLASTR